MITAKIIADSVSPAGKRITTFLLQYPRFVHSEFMTHRAFSRNAASSRAIPVKTMIAKLRETPAMPIYWGASQKGMQAGEELTGESLANVKLIWLRGMEDATRTAEAMLESGLHKQIANRVLEPWAHMETLVTATEYDNFFALRCHPDAQPEIQTLAFAMLREYVKHEPTFVPLQGWHVPYGDRLPVEMPICDKIKIATARAARTSYMNFDGTSDTIKDLEMHDRLSEAGHWSPFEHCATAAQIATAFYGNFSGWVPYRKMFQNENRSVTNYEHLLTTTPDFVKRALDDAP